MSAAEADTAKLSNLSAAGNGQTPVTATDNKDISNILNHMKSLEEAKTTLEAQLKERDDRITSLSAAKRAEMESALNTIVKTWIDANETKDPAVKENFYNGCKHLVDKSDENNGVWQMMVAASNLHARQEHDLDKLRSENKELKTRVDGMYNTSDSRTGEKRARTEDETTPANSIWDDFASSMRQF